MVVIQYTNLLVLRGDEFVQDDLWVQDGLFIDAKARWWAAVDQSSFQPDVVVDCQGYRAAPGYIDVQFNGGFGVDFSSADLTVEDIRQVGRTLVKYGVTAYCPTLISSSRTEYEAVMAVFRAHRDRGGVGEATSLGLHLEGPFFSRSKIGAHNANYIQTPDKGARSLVDAYGESSLRGTDVAIITLAPELDGALDAIAGAQQATGSGTVVSMGHSSANIHEAKAGADAGATMITHLFNAMGSFHHRDPGIIGLLGIPEYRSRIHYGIIVDGIHCHSSSISIATQSHPHGLVLVTDAMAATGLGVGSHHLGTMKVDVLETEIDHGAHALKAVIHGTNTLAGSVVTLDVCVRNLVRFTNCKESFALRAASQHPAKCLGLDHERGGLDAGKRADFVLLDGCLHVVGTFIAGRKVWSQEQGKFAEVGRR